MRFYTMQHKFYCGIDLHARDMYVCIVNQGGDIVVHRNLKTKPDTLLQIMGPYREDKANRAGVAERFPDPVVQKSLAGDLALLEYYDRLLTALEPGLVNTAKAHKAQVCSRLRSIPGVGKILALVLRYAIHDIQRFPRVQEFVFYGRLVKGAKGSAGKRYGTSGAKIGNAYLKWAFSEAAVLFLRNTPAGAKYRTRLEKKPGKGNALTVLAHRLAQAVYDMFKRETACRCRPNKKSGTKEKIRSSG